MLNSNLHSSHNEQKVSGIESMRGGPSICVKMAAAHSKGLNLRAQLAGAMSER